ncbi:MAG TPA: efflux RND transporter periplasmic adaptor subunit [Pirellulales bacterium]|nr:efflux RND transporter periplasmic adaptor subunit [Pirellulales bacterium]
MKYIPIKPTLFRIWVSAWAVLLAGFAGCEKPSPTSLEAKKATEITVVCPQHSSLQWTVRQPAYIEAFEETPIVPKIAGYVKKWHMDIGDHVKKGEVLAELWVPDLVADLNQKKTEVEQSRKMLEVAECHLASVAASVEEARAGLGRAQANCKFWQAQFERISSLDRTVIDQQVKEETRNQLQSAEAGMKEAEAKVTRSEADRKESEAVRNKSRVDIAVAEAAREKMRTLVDYATLTAPYDGVVTRRHINTGDFVQPPSAAQNDPLYVVQRRDLMRVFAEVPETDAVWVQDGDPVKIHIPVIKDRDFAGTVKRTSYSLRRQSRTLLAEIDIPNPADFLRPGMYAYAAIEVERRDVLSLPTAAVATQGEVNEGYQNFCFVVENGKVRRTLVEVGAHDERRVEVLKKQVQGTWRDFTGEEDVVEGEISSLADGQKVHISADVKQSQSHRTAHCMDNSPGET